MPLSVSIFLHYFVPVLFVCVFTKNPPQTEVASGSMKRSVSTIADQRVNGLWEEEKSPERIYRPRHRSYKAAGLCCFYHHHSVFCSQAITS